jgi:succinate dehydrogenase hydrophobic anchor subunit
MQVRSGRTVGLVMAATGVVVVLVAVGLFGLTKTSNGETTVDWVSVMTAIGGLVIAGRGLYAALRNA